MYQPDPIKHNNSALGKWLEREFNKIASWSQAPQVEYLQYKVWNAAPDKPRTAQKYYADGTNWNPGSGEGLYIYLSTGSWSKL